MGRRTASIITGTVCAALAFGLGAPAAGAAPRDAPSVVDVKNRVVDLKFGDAIVVDLLRGAKHTAPRSAVEVTVLKVGDDMVRTVKDGEFRVTAASCASRTVRYRYTATAAGVSDSATLTVRIRDHARSCASATPIKVTSKKRGTKPVVKVDVRNPRASGRAVVTIKKNGKYAAKRTVVLEGGKATVRMPRLPVKGKYTVTFDYPGAWLVEPSSFKSKITVR